MSDAKTTLPAINDVQASQHAGMLLADVRHVDETPGAFVSLPPGATVHSLEQLQDRPIRARGTVAVRDAASFSRLILSRKNVRGLRVYGVMTPSPKFVAVLNDHSAYQPGWRDDRIVYDCPLSREWKIWTAASGKQMDQVAFAQFIEDNLPDIATPPAADMLEISRTLEAKKKVNFASGVRLHNGEHQITYEEQVDGTAAKGRLKVPETFSIGIAVLEGCDRYQVEARLRYRIAEGGKLTMWFDLIRPQRVLEDAATFVWKWLETELGETIVHGEITQ